MLLVVSETLQMLYGSGASLPLEKSPNWQTGADAMRQLL